MIGSKKNPNILREQRFIDLYLPGIKNEDWQYTNLKKQFGDHLSLQPFSSHKNDVFIKNVFKTRADLLGQKNILFFIDGVFEESISSPPKGLVIKKLSHRGNSVQSLYLNKKGDGFSINNNDSYSGFDSFIRKAKLIELNALLITAPNIFHFDKHFKLRESIKIIYIQSNPSPLFNQARALFLLEKNISVVLEEEVINLGAKQSVLNLVSETICLPGASLNIYKTQNDTTNSCLIRTSFFVQKKGSAVKCHFFSLNGKLIRNNILANLTESGADCSILGTSFLNNSSHLDNFIKISHLEKNCTSNQLFKSVYGGLSSGVFCGKIFVAKKAQKTQAFQQNKNLVVSKNAVVNAKPQLEIFADDVVCSHGCTIGDIDVDALFYLRSRGLSKQEAIKLLIVAFLNDMLSNIEHKKIKENLIKLFLQQQPHA